MDFREAAEGGVMIVLSLLVIGQMVSFEGPYGYATVTGNPEEQIRFYEIWREYIHPTWRDDGQMFWIKEWTRIQKDVHRSQELLYSTDRRTRTALAQAIILRGYTVRFRVTIDPFGKFWIYYNSIGHAIVAIGALILFSVWYRRRTKRTLKQPK